MRQLRFVALATAGALFVTAPAFAADSPVVGTWATEAKSDFGTFKSTWTVAQAGGAYTVDVKDAPMAGGPGGGDGAPPKSTVSNVKVDGSTLSFDRELVMGDMTIKISYTATANGSALTGQSHVSFGDMPMDIPITGTRQ